MLNERLTHKRANGIKTGYWSPATKENLVQVLADYENTGLTPEEIRVMQAELQTLKQGIEDIHKGLAVSLNNYRRKLETGQC